ncbi:hypothetical protein WMF28_09910 [Sorangium sp. So ce590]|uniref:hypothetical protein n=1 Tax=Sorangium sp. So ce590 TaxID=3133317 RepID=UPI003F61C2C6
MQQQLLGVASKDEAAADLADVVGRLDRCLKRALQEYVESYAHLRHRHSARTRSSTINDLIVAHVKEEFDSSDVAVGRSVHNTYELTIKDKYKARFKKLSKSFQASNIPTQMSIEFVGQLQFPFLQITNLHVGYVASQDALTLTDSPRYIVCPSGSSHRWKLEITGEGDRLDLVADSAQPMVANDQVATKKRVTLRRESKQADASEAEQVADVAVEK